MSPASDAVPFSELANADLIVDALYEGGTAGTIADDVLARLLPVGNQGGFRYAGSPQKGTVRLAVLFTTGADMDWPDTLDPQTGVFTYYGDNKKPGRALNDTQRGGNRLLESAFDRTHAEQSARGSVPPFLLFQAAPPGRRVRFRGLLAPGAAGLKADEDLVAIWRTTGGNRFQNYRASFTVLAEAKVTRAWIQDILAGNAVESPHCPEAWKAWVAGRVYRALTAPSTKVIRSRAEQLPTDSAGEKILSTIREHYRGRETDFETCAIEIWRLIAPATGTCDQTRPSRDGGRDAIGQYVLGPAADPIHIDFALEAKCYAPTTSVGVRDVARLISRLRHRDFGVFVTTSHFNQQVYDEVRTDEHPIALICGRDIIEALRTKGYTTVSDVQKWLDQIRPAEGL